MVRAALIALTAAFVAWLAVRAAMVHVLPVGSAQLQRIAPHDPDVILDEAMSEFIVRRGFMRPQTLAAVRRAAIEAPLDARPYLFAGIQDLVQHEDSRALATFEAGRRLNPRDRWIHIMLLDRYLRANRYRDAASEFAVLARLVGAASGPIAQMLAQMTLDPSKRVAVRLTLAKDPALENSVLATLASTGADPALLFGMASPHALRNAGRPDSWGPILIASMVGKGRFAAAHAVWARIYGLPPAETSATIYDARFEGLRGSAPFNWTDSAGTIGDVDIGKRAMTVDYYGRDSGELANQLLLLSPGRYRMKFALSGSAGSGGTALGWSIACAERPDQPIMTLTLPPPTTATKRLAAEFSVPASDCTAQMLRLTAQAGEFPAPIQVEITDLSLQSMGAAQ